MAILQISKIQQRSGNLVDLPQLDDAEFGWASDAKRLFIGKTTPNENIEVLTSYSTIDFSQINGVVGNINVNPVTLAAGELLVYDGTNWVNRGGNAGGIINLGSVSNVKITGGAIGYVLETDGTGNLTWTPKSTLASYVQQVVLGNGAVGNLTTITTTQDNFFVEGAEVTITNVPGTTQLNGNSYFLGIETSNTFALYTDAGLTTALDATGYGEFPYADVTATDTTSDHITVSDSTYFTVNDPVVFGGDVDTANSDIIVGQTYYVKTKDTSGPNVWITISETLGGNTFSPRTTSGLTGFVYVTGGRVISSIGGAGGTANAGGSTNSVQYNNSNLLEGDSNFTWDFTSQILSVNGNANVGNLNSNGVVTSTRFISNVATGVAPPLAVSSTDRVANLNVSYANVSDFGVVTTQTTGIYYPVFVNSSSTGNRALGANANIAFNAATGNLSVTLLNVTANANAGNIGASGLIVATGNVTGGNLNTAGIANIGGNANVSGNLNLTGNANVAANLSASNATLANLLTVGGNANVTGNLNVTANANITANLAANNGSFGNLLTVGANANVTGNVNVTANANVSGNVTSTRVISTVATGTAPLTVTSTTRVSNLNVANAGFADSAGTATTATSATTAGTVTTAAQPNITSVGTLSSLSISGALTTTQITAGANTTPGTITGNWTLTTGSRMQATYADLAEYYEADREYEPGTVLMFGGEKEVTIAEDGTNRVAGVVSTNPAYVMNATCPGLLTALALQGRVPCKVRGIIKKGDMMVSGGNGFARPEKFPSMGTVIGKALQDFDGYEGIIEVAVGRL